MALWLFCFDGWGFAISLLCCVGLSELDTAELFGWFSLFRVLVK